MGRYQRRTPYADPDRGGVRMVQDDSDEIWWSELCPVTELADLTMTKEEKQGVLGVN